MGFIIQAGYRIETIPKQILRRRKYVSHVYQNALRSDTFKCQMSKQLCKFIHNTQVKYLFILKIKIYTSSTDSLRFMDLFQINTNRIDTNSIERNPCEWN